MHKRPYIPMQLKAPMEVLGPTESRFKAPKDSYALVSFGYGVIGEWPGKDDCEDGHWRLTKLDAQFIADACNEKVARDNSRMTRKVYDSLCEMGCDVHREIEDTEGNLWPCPIHGDHALGHRNRESIGPNPVTDTPMTGEDIYALMMVVAEQAYRVGRGDSDAIMSVGDINKVVDRALRPEPIPNEQLVDNY